MKSGCPVTLELHVEPVDLPFVPLFGAEEVYRDALTIHWHERDVLVPSATHFVAHNVIHSLLVDTAGKLAVVSMRQLFEFVHACQAHEHSIRWPDLRNRFEKQGYGKTLRRYCALARVCLNFMPPNDIVVGAWDRLRVHWYLVRLDLDSPSVEWTMNFFSQMKTRLKNVTRKPGLIIKLTTADFYVRWLNSLKR